MLAAVHSAAVLRTKAGIAVADFLLVTGGDKEVLAADDTLARIIAAAQAFIEICENQIQIGLKANASADFGFAFARLNLCIGKQAAGGICFQIIDNRPEKHLGGVFFIAGICVGNRMNVVEEKKKIHWQTKQHP